MIISRPLFLTSWISTQARQLARWQYYNQASTTLYI